MRILFSILLSFVLAGIAIGKEPAEKFRVEDYYFQWQIAQSGDMKVEIVKTDDDIRVRIGEGMSSLSMTPKNAAAIGRALAIASPSSPKDIKAGDYSLSVHQEENERAASVTIQSNRSMSFESVTLNQRQARDLSKPLSECVERAAYLDKVIDSALLH